MAGSGICDLSPNLESNIPPWRKLSFTGILCDQWIPTGIGRLKKLSDARSYNGAIAEATHAEGASVAIYFEQKRENFDMAMLNDPARTIDSPLSHKVCADHRSTAYCAALLHLLEYASGKPASIVGVNKNKAWRLVVERYPDPATQIRCFLSAEHDPI